MYRRGRCRGRHVHRDALLSHGREHGHDGRRARLHGLPAGASGGALLSIGDLHAVMARGEATFVAIEAAGEATVSLDLHKAPTGSLGSLRAPRVETEDDVICVGLGDPVQDSIIMAQESMFQMLTQDYGYSAADAYVVMSAAAHSELGGPTGSKDPDPLHPFRAVGAVTLARISKRFLQN